MLRYGFKLTSGVDVSHRETQDCAGDPVFTADTIKDGISVAEAISHWIFFPDATGRDELIAAMSKANPKTIVGVTAGSNVDSRSWISNVPSLLQTWYDDQEGGRALAEILFGAVNPSSHLLVTFERNSEDNPTFTHHYPAEGQKKIFYKEGIFVGYRGCKKNKTFQLFPFGSGLLHCLQIFEFRPYYCLRSRCYDSPTHHISRARGGRVDVMFPCHL